MFSNLHLPLLGNLGGGVLSEAAALLNGAHIGMNSRLGGLLKRQQQIVAAASNDTNRGHNVDHHVVTIATATKQALYDAVLGELGVQSIDVRAMLKEKWLPMSHDCSVTDIVKSCDLRRLHNPYSLSFQRHFSSFSTYHKHHRHWRSLSQIRPLTKPLGLRYLSEFHLTQLENRANSETDNPKAQAQYLEAVYQTDPQYVVRRFESGRYAINDDVRKIYHKAVVLSQKLSVNEQRRGTAIGSIFDDIITSSDTSHGSKENPVHVIMQPRRGGVLRELWYLARFVIIAFVITTFISSALFTQMKGGTQQMTKDFRPDTGDKDYSFEDVQGIDEAKSELQEMVEFLKNPNRFKKLGAKLPTGVLLIGPPGTGKTLLAKAIAGEAEVPFFFASGSEFDEMFVGVGAARVRKLFEQARRNKPCVVFIDELDAVGGARVTSAIHPYSRMTLNQLLVELDGYKELEGVVVIGATNFPESLDKALIRPGRFDTHVQIPMPDVRARYNILKVHAKKIKLAPDLNLETVARGTPGFSGADLANLINQSALKASADGKNEVTNEDIEFARDKIIMGPERRSAVIEEKNRELVAYHEGGHAIVALYTPGALPIHKATIIPRGPALGMVSMLPEKDELSWSKKQLMAKMDVAMGGRVAEEIIFGTDNITSGASSDFESATKIATAMVTKFAMSDQVGPVAHGNKDKTSPATQKVIEDEIKRLLKEAHDRAHVILKTHSVEHRRLAEALLKYETLDAEEIKLVIAAKPLPRKI